MRRSTRNFHPMEWGEKRLYDVWPTKTQDTIEGLELTAELLEKSGQHDKAEQVRKGIRAFEGRP